MGQHPLVISHLELIAAQGHASVDACEEFSEAKNRAPIIWKLLIHATETFGGTV